MTELLKLPCSCGRNVDLGKAVEFSAMMMGEGFCYYQSCLDLYCQNCKYQLRTVENDIGYWRRILYAKKSK